MSVHNLGFPRIGKRRELKKHVEAFWRGDIDEQTLQTEGKTLRKLAWQQQAEAGVELMPVGDFAWYDHVLNMSNWLGVIPQRFHHLPKGLTQYFAMARGYQQQGETLAACKMTKWFDTNYHYIVPELEEDQGFQLHVDDLLAQIKEAQQLGHQVKPVLVGPVTYLWLSEVSGQGDKLRLLPALLEAYGQLLQHLADLDIAWVQLDEPALTLDLSVEWRQAYEQTYHHLQTASVKILLATYFAGLGDNLTCAVNLPVAGLHIDAVRAPEQLISVVDRLPRYKVLSVGIINGRSVWRADLRQLLQTLKPVYQAFGDNLWLAPSCSLLHVPVDLELETQLDTKVKPGLAFAIQKLHELSALSLGLCEGEAKIAAQLEVSDQGVQARQLAVRPVVQKRLATLTAQAEQRSQPYAERAKVQRALLQLPLLPTTTIGSFPQTSAIRQLRAKFRKGDIDIMQYHQSLQKEIQFVIQKQEALDLDVLVHGEPERTDMVEYFAEQLAGFVTTQYGWVQSYGSRCVRPPIVIGDVERQQPMTVGWSAYAQSLSNKPVKGMLTGPVTILQWSYPRDDVAPEVSAFQIALALRDEVADLEKAGIHIVQIDEPAFREGVPLQKAAQAHYLHWATRAFRIASAGAKPTTQIHTHMCYSDFNSIIEHIAAMDADVITIESTRAKMQLLAAFEAFSYPNEIGPGVYDIHSPSVPTADDVVKLLQAAIKYIPVERLWVNPDCGLKTRNWDECERALAAMVNAAKQLRQSLVSEQAEKQADLASSTA
ncbi:5-methyltetrahydropteroyltriglutamate--homocysteine S-methyltransferase [Zooshikella harenae]|uniref:5-methyltetrahydropteroyltriglutamate--homocysteine methyltransferase n=1 Tax=Zooshikella harenae TaxID=2827238 RepID=A0ABS5ZD73_9GAMM|nr:5-methyltetrahydropteroyltriglutamate--homocysteine S-methyltransferase [Zooshikella harenae]MBU2712012.1 5-methyltetrahydropteroyltriglutamate--homocysteine S-methyltransferase [Zooshikella harenae]